MAGTGSRREVLPDSSANADAEVVKGFGDEWSRFDHSTMSPEELNEMWENYFHLFPWNRLPADAMGFDLGCGSGRWARLVAPRVGRLHLIDPSAEALEVAKRNLADAGNCDFHLAAVDQLPIPENSADFGYSLGVLHHIPDTVAGLRACVSRLKPGAPFLLYLYYSFDNRPWWYRGIWKASDILRRTVSVQPLALRHFLSEILAVTIYWPLSRLSRLGEALNLDVSNWPLSWYRNRSFYVLRTDALDRFGTRLEKRFSQAEIRQMMTQAGLIDIRFSDRSFWTAVGFRA